MKSMTGYGTLQFKSVNLQLDIVIKAVNGRYLDLRCHLPREYADFESKIKESLSTLLQRGTVDISVYRKSSGSGESLFEIKVDKQMIKELRKQLGEDISLETLLKIAPIVKIKQDETVKLGKSEFAQVKSALAKAFSIFDQSRQREGLALKKNIEGNLKGLKDLVAEMSKERKLANALLMERAGLRISQMEKQTSVDPQRLAQEVAIQVDRSDIHEELVRLAEHMNEFAKLCRLSEPIGRKLDFYTQELLREVNTIGSKSQVARLTQLVVEAKTVIERIREQVQNIL